VNLRILTIGHCTGRHLASEWNGMGVAATAFTPESCWDLLPENCAAGTLRAELDRSGMPFLKCEFRPVAERIAESDLIVIYPFYESRRLVRDRRTGCTVYLRVRPGSKYATMVHSAWPGRFECVVPDRENYVERLAEGLLNLSARFPEKRFIFVAAQHSDGWIMPDPLFHIPFVSDTFDDFRLLWRRGLPRLAERLGGARNFAMISADAWFERLASTAPFALQHVFPYVVPAGGPARCFRRDVAHVSRCALRYLAGTLIGNTRSPGRWLDPDHWDLYQLDTDGKRRMALHQRSIDLWANGVESVMWDPAPRRFLDDVSRSLQTILLDRNDPALLVAIFAFVTLLHVTGLELQPVAREAILHYFRNKDQDYGVWSDFAAQISTALEALQERNPVARRSSEQTLSSMHLMNAEHELGSAVCSAVKMGDPKK